MPTLIVATLPLPPAALEGVLDLRRAGEAVALAAAGLAADVASAAELEAAFDNERLARLAPPPLPDWLRPEEFDRILIAGAEHDPAHAAWAAAWRAAGCEAVEWLPLEALEEISQSWFSGRRVGKRL